MAEVEEFVPASSVSLSKVKSVPRLSLSVSLKDKNGNNLFEGRERVNISISARNMGSAPAYATRLVIKGAERLGFQRFFL